ncbi:hypothetical protein D3C80_2155170 [compost metagenome]
MKVNIGLLFPEGSKNIGQCAGCRHRQFECAMFQAGQVHELLLPLLQFKQSSFCAAEEADAEFI